MKEQLFTIPVGDAFRTDCECPVCKLYEDLEKESINAKIFEDLDVTDPDELRVIPKVELTDEWKKIADIIKIDLETELWMAVKM